MDSMRRLPFPPGFRFHPTDQELVSYYLKHKVRGHQMSDVIAEIDLYRFEPWDLPAMSQIQTKDLEWYFFTPRDTKHSNSSRMSRATAAGYWKATGKARSVGSASRTVGVKKTLVYYKGRAPRGERTNWVMHEYSLEDSECERLKVLQNGFVLCRVFKKSGPGPRNGDQYGAPFEEEDDWSVVPVNEQQYSASPEIEQREAVSGNLELEAGDTPFCGDTTLMNCHVPDQQKISILEDTQKILDSDKDKNLQKEEWSRVASTGNKEIDTVGNQTKHFNGTTVMEPPGDTFSSPCPTYLEPVTNHGVVAHECQSIKSDGKEHDEREILEELLGLIVGENIMNEANETKTMEINALYSHSDGNALFGNLPMDGSSLNDTELLDGDFLELDDLLLPCSEKEVEEQLSAGETGIQIRVRSSLPFSYSDMNAVSSFKSRLQKNLIHFPQEGSDRMMHFHVANTQEQPLVPDTPVQSNPPEKDFKCMENPLARSKATAGFEELDYDFVLDFFEQLHAVNSASVDDVEDVSHLTKSKIIGQTQSEVTPCLDTGESKNLEDELDSLWVSAADVALDESIQCLQAPNKISGSEMFSDFATPEFGCNASQLQSSLGPLIESDGMIPLACLGVEEVLFPGNALQSDVQEQRPAGLMNSEQTNLLYGEPMQDPNLTSSNGWAGIMSKGLSSLLNVLDSVPAFPASAAELSPKAVSSVSVMTTSVNTTLTLACSSHDTDSSCPNCSSTVDKQGRFVKSQFHKEKVSNASKKGFLTIALLGAFWAFFWLLLAGSAWKFMNFIYKIITSCKSWKLGASML